jgi:hypothetical protein
MPTRRHHVASGRPGSGIGSRVCWPWAACPATGRGRSASVGTFKRLLASKAITLHDADRVLPRAADLWVEASLDQRQRFQQLFYPEGIAFDGNSFDGTA